MNVQESNADIGISTKEIREKQKCSNFKQPLRPIDYTFLVYKVHFNAPFHFMQD